MSRRKQSCPQRHEVSQEPPLNQKLKASEGICTAAPNTPSYSQSVDGNEALDLSVKKRRKDSDSKSKISDVISTSACVNMPATTQFAPFNYPLIHPNNFNFTLPPPPPELFNSSLASSSISPSPLPFLAMSNYVSPLNGPSENSSRTAGSRSRDNSQKHSSTKNPNSKSKGDPEKASGSSLDHLSNLVHKVGNPANIKTAPGRVPGASSADGEFCKTLKNNPSLQQGVGMHELWWKYIKKEESAEIKRVNEAKQIFTCLQCQNSFQSMDSLVKHMELTQHFTNVPKHYSRIVKPRKPVRPASEAGSGSRGAPSPCTSPDDPSTSWSLQYARQKMRQMKLKLKYSERMMYFCNLCGIPFTNPVHQHFTDVHDSHNPVDNMRFVQIVMVNGSSHSVMEPRTSTPSSGSSGYDSPTCSPPLKKPPSARAPPHSDCAAIGLAPTSVGVAPTSVGAAPTSVGAAPAPASEAPIAAVAKHKAQVKVETDHERSEKSGQNKGGATEPVNSSVGGFDLLLKMEELVKNAIK